MIEVIYKEETEENQEPFAMPRNVRQIGLANGDYRIYIEDYVYTFLRTLAEEKTAEDQGNVAVLTGEIRWAADMTCIFVKGALAADEMEAAAEHLDFSENIWQKIQENKEKYFSDQEIVGWFFARQQLTVEMSDFFVKVHLRHFGGEKVLMLMDPAEREDAFFRYDGGTMVKLGGYYIYYEKNSQMQTYMIERSQKEGQDGAEKVEDKAVRNFRKIIDSKKPEEQESEKNSAFSYVATICLAVAVLAAGVSFYQRQQERTAVSETSTETSAAVVEMTPVITKKIQKTEPPVITVSPTPAAAVREQQKKPATPPEKKEVKKEKKQTAKEKEKKESAAETAAPAANSGETYVIRPGDTLYQISLNRYGTVDAMEKICKANGISPSEIIYPGQVIVLP